jgi:hypothetical protein
VDAKNRISVNFHPLPSGRFVIARTCAGPPEYSGRGGHQLYTHFLIVDEGVMQTVAFQPFAIYRSSIALGYLLYQTDPGDILEPVKLSELFPARDAANWAAEAVALGLPPLGPLGTQLQSGQPLRFAYAGDRIALAECLFGVLPPEVARATSVSTSLVPSTDRPFVLTLVSDTPT